MQYIDIEDFRMKTLFALGLLSISTLSFAQEKPVTAAELNPAILMSFSCAEFLGIHGTTFVLSLEYRSAFSSGTKEVASIHGHDKKKVCSYYAQKLNEHFSSAKRNYILTSRFECIDQKLYRVNTRHQRSHTLALFGTNDQERVDACEAMAADLNDIFIEIE